MGEVFLAEDTRDGHARRARRAVARDDLSGKYDELWE